MSTEIARHGAGAAGGGSPPAAREIDLEAMADAVVKGGMWPEVRTREAALSLMLLCQAEGLHPVNALRRYHIIEGKPSMRADALLAEFQRHGGRVAWHERTPTVVRATYSHPDLCPDGVEITTTFEELREVATARDKAGKPFLKKNWRIFPRQMLTARNISEGVRLVDPAVVVGLYTPEEVVDFDDRDRPLAEHHDRDAGTARVIDPGRQPRSQLPEGGGPEQDRVVREALEVAARDVNGRWLDYWSTSYEPEPIPEGFPAEAVSFHQLAGHMVKHFGGPTTLNPNHRVRFLGARYLERREAFEGELARYCEAQLARTIDELWKKLDPPAEDRSQEDAGAIVPEVISHPVAPPAAGEPDGVDYDGSPYDPDPADDEAEIDRMAARDAAPARPAAKARTRK